MIFPKMSYCIPSEIKLNSIEKFVYHSLKKNIYKQEPLFFLKEPNGDWFLALSIESMFFSSGKNRIQKIKKKLKKENKTKIPWVGAVCFSEKKNKEPWKDFPNTLFYQPKHFLQSKSSKITLQSHKKEDFYELHSYIKKQSKGPMDLLTEKPYCAIDKEKEKKKWSNVFDKAKSYLNKNTLNKIVIFKKKEMLFNNEVAHHELWSNFIHSFSNENSYKFFFHWKGSSFIGFSPESLFIREGSFLSTEAVAGTATRGCTEKEDKLKERALRACPKNKEEHQYVVDFLKKKLKRLFPQAILLGEREILKLSYVQHLRTKLSLKSKKKVHSLDILRMLHPSPAMCGYPKKQAQKVLSSLNNAARGLYASPIGFFDADQNTAKFLVAIRSALLCQKKLHVFSGAGLLRNSQKEEEWEESEEKLKTILSIFDRK